MRLVIRTLKKVVIEVTNKEIKEKGFDYIWDKIRNVYKVNDYEIFIIETNQEKQITYIELLLDGMPSQKK